MNKIFFVNWFNDVLFSFELEEKSKTSNGNFSWFSF